MTENNDNDNDGGKVYLLRYNERQDTRLFWFVTADIRYSGFNSRIMSYCVGFVIAGRDR